VSRALLAGLKLRASYATAGRHAKIDWKVLSKRAALILGGALSSAEATKDVAPGRRRLPRPDLLGVPPAHPGKRHHRLELAADTRQKTTDRPGRLAMHGFATEVALLHDAVAVEGDISELSTCVGWARPTSPYCSDGSVR
jgi:hypothetical protein